MTDLTPQSSAAQCWQDHDFRAFADGGFEAADVADAFSVHEDVHVRADLAALGDDAIAEAGALAPEHRQRIFDGMCLAVGAYVAAIVRELAERTGDDEVQGHQGTMAALTATMGGSASAISV